MNVQIPAGEISFICLRGQQVFTFSHFVARLPHSIFQKRNRKKRIKRKNDKKDMKRKIKTNKKDNQRMAGIHKFVCTFHPLPVVAFI